MEFESSNGKAEVEIDCLSFAVRTRKFRIQATVMRRTWIALATEFGLRLVHLIPDLAPEDIGAFLGFTAAETRVLVEDLLNSGLVDVGVAGTLKLSQRGLEAVSPMTEALDVFDLDEIRATPSFDLIAFAPADDTDLGADGTGLLDELPIPDRERASRSATAAREAFEQHFTEWRLKHGTRYDDEARIYVVDDVRPVRTFVSSLSVSVTHRPGEDGLKVDFSELFSLGRPGSRDPLVNALRTRIQHIPVASDFEEAFALVEGLDGALFRRSGVGSPLQQNVWASLASDANTRTIQSADGPGLRLIGSTASDGVRAALLDWSRSMPSLADAALPPTPILWLQPVSSHWGRSLAFLRTARGLSTAYEAEGGTVLLARTDGTSKVRQAYERLYGRKGETSALFDRCLAVSESALPHALEIVIRPFAWVMVLIHAPDSKTGLPFPFGYITAAPDTVGHYEHLLAELVAQSPNSGAFIWTAPGETAPDALAAVDLALSIQGT